MLLNLWQAAKNTVRDVVFENFTRHVLFFHQTTCVNTRYVIRSERVLKQNSEYSWQILATSFATNEFGVLTVPESALFGPFIYSSSLSALNNRQYLVDRIRCECDRCTRVGVLALCNLPPSNFLPRIYLIDFSISALFTLLPDLFCQSLFTSFISSCTTPISLFLPSFSLCFTS